MAKNARNQDPRANKDRDLERKSRSASAKQTQAERKSVPMRKAKAKRANRHADAIALQAVAGIPDATRAEAAEAAMDAHRPKTWDRTATDRT